MQEKRKNTVILTGVPRSGTSLLTKLTSQHPNTLCLSEPTWIKKIRFDGQSIKQFANALEEKISSIREEIKKGNPIEITVKKGTKKLPDNYYLRKRENISNLKDTISINVEHSEDLLIFVKANTIFTAALSEILKNDNWRVFGMIRNPLYVLMSWRSLNIPVSQGKIKIGELYSNYLRQAVLEKNLLIRQIKILDWFYKKYHEQNVNIIRYEQLIEQPQASLSKIINNSHLQIKLQSSNTPQRYHNSESDKIIKKLKLFSHYAKKFYPKF